MLLSFYEDIYALSCVQINFTCLFYMDTVKSQQQLIDGDAHLFYIIIKIVVWTVFKYCWVKNEVVKDWIWDWVQPYKKYMALSFKFGGFWHENKWQWMCNVKPFIIFQIWPSLMSFFSCLTPFIYWFKKKNTVYFHVQLIIWGAKIQSFPFFYGVCMISWNETTRKWCHFFVFDDEWL